MLRVACRLAMALAGLIFGVTGARAATMNFPGDRATEATSSRGFTVFYVDPNPTAADHVFELKLRYPGGRVDQIDEFGRNVDVSWSPDGRRLFVTDWAGSNVADCLAVTPSPSGTRKRSLTGVIVRARMPRVEREIRQASHGYVSCNRWLSPTRVEVEVHGDICEHLNCTSRFFDDFLVYDLRTGRLQSKRRPPPPPLRSPPPPSS